MKLDEGDSLVGVATCREGQDVFLATRKARSIRFQITEDTLRVFAGRDSSGVRGIRLATGDEVNSLCVLTHVDASVEERSAYLRAANAKRRAEAAANAAGTEEEIEEIASDDADEAIDAGDLTQERFDELAAQEEILLTVTDAGFGRRSSAYEYRVSGRGGQGIANMTLTNPKRGREVVATLPTLDGTDVMMVTDVGRLIRVPVSQVRVMARQASGVTLFRVGAEERVTSIFPVAESEGTDADDAETSLEESDAAASGAQDTPAPESTASDEATPDDSAN